MPARESTSPLRVAAGELTTHEVQSLPSSTLATGHVPIKGRSFTGLAGLEVELPDGQTAENRLFYWLFRSQSTTTHPAGVQPIPLIVWLNGGPGSSSLLGLFMENGPFKVQSDPAASLVPNPETWDQRCHVLYWDQPVGTGFSTSSAGTAGYVTDEHQIAHQFCTALDMFFAQHGDYRDCPFFITGESYAGMYIPSISAELVQHPDRYPHVPQLAGISIGDGRMVPGPQVQVKLDYAYALGFLDTRQYEHLSAERAQLQALIDDGEMQAAYRLGNSITESLLTWAGMPNIFDVRTFNQPSPAAVGAYLNAPAVQQAIGVDTTWVNFQGVEEALAADVYRSALPEIVALLRHARDSDFRALFYTGDFDMQCGFLGTERMLWDLNYPVLGDGEPTADDWQSLERQIWVDGDGPPLGYLKSLGNLTQVTVVGAGHLVPLDRPLVSREMMYSWLFGRPFQTRVPGNPE